MITRALRRANSGFRIGFLLRALALLSLYIPYLVHAEQEYQYKYAQLYPHAHDVTFLKAYSFACVFIPRDDCRSRPRPSTPRSRPSYGRRTDSEIAAKRAKKNRPAGRFFLQPRLPYKETRLTVSDVHSDFEAETQISCCRCSPCHDYLLVVLRGFINSLRLRPYKTSASGWIMHPLPGLSHERIP